MADDKINDLSTGDNFVFNNSKIIPEEDLFVDEEKENINRIEYSNSDMYLSIFSDDSDEDCFLNNSKKKFKINTLDNLTNVTYEKDANDSSNLFFGQTFNDTEELSNHNEDDSFFSDDEVQDSTENNKSISDSFFSDDENEIDEVHKRRKIVNTCEVQSQILAKSDSSVQTPGDKKSYLEKEAVAPEVNQKEANARSINKKRKRFKLFSSKSWMGSEEYLKINPSYD